jgi:hypothetical protein
MSTDTSSLKTIQAALMEGASQFVTALSSGASHEQLLTILAEMRDLEQQLIKDGGVMLDPEVWRILHSRLDKRWDLGPDVL